MKLRPSYQAQLDSVRAEFQENPVGIVIHKKTIESLVKELEVLNPKNPAVVSGLEALRYLNKAVLVSSHSESGQETMDGNGWDALAFAYLHLEQELDKEALK